MSDATLIQQALRTASVNGLFTLEGLCGAMSLSSHDKTRRDLIWRALGPVSDEHVSDQGHYCWQIGPDARRAALRQFYALPHLQRFMRQAAMCDGQSLADPFSAALAALLQGHRISFDDPGVSADVGELRRAIAHAAGIMDAAQFVAEVPALQDHDYQVRTSVHETYHRMKIGALARFADAQIKDLQARSDLRIVVPHKHFGYTPEREVISKFARGKGAERPLLLTGIGGAGKSALLSRLMLGWQRSEPELVQILLDFDRRQLSLGEPIEILQEILRQLSAFLQLHLATDTALREGLSALRRDIALFKTDQGGNQSSNSFQMSFALRLISQLQEDWAKPLRTMQIVLVLDTFEAIDRMAVYHRQFTEFAPNTYKGNEVVSQIMQILQTMQQNYLPNMRVIVSGREEPLSDDELDNWFGPRVRLDGLYHVSGAKLLQAEVVRLNPANAPMFADAAKARKVSRLLGGHPLAIIAFARYADRNTGDVDGLITEIEAEGGFAAEFAQVFLYTRILNRITDRQVRPLAHPGLMLRFIDSELILHVLAGPCLGREAGSDDPMTPADAEELFVKLRNQYWLVSPVEGSEDTVKHIPDLRRLMLPGLLAGPRQTDRGKDRDRKLDLQRRALAVCRTAARFFEERGQGTDSLDALYYGSFNSEPPMDFPKSQASKLDKHLGEDVATMPAAWRAVIGQHLGRDLSERELAALPDTLRAEESMKARAKADQTGTRIYTKGSAEEAAVEAAMTLNVEWATPQAAVSLSNVSPKDTPSAEEVFANRSLLEQSYSIEAAWKDAFQNTSDRAAVFIESCLKAAVLPGLAKDLLRIEGDARIKPFENALYLSVLLRMTDHTPWTPRFGPYDTGSPDYPETLRYLLLAAAHAEQMDFGAAAKVLHHYLPKFIQVQPVAANRLAASKILQSALDYDALPDFKVSLDMQGLSLAAGFRYDFDKVPIDDAGKGRKSKLTYQRATKALWDEYQQDHVTLSTLERFYRSKEPLDIWPVEYDKMSDPQRRHFLTMLRGLNPELHAPTIALLAGLDFHDGERVVLDTSHDLALWPIDLQFDDQQIYSPTDASAVVLTADRCGALRILLSHLAKHEPFAERLIAIYDLITRIYYPEIDEYLPQTMS